MPAGHHELELAVARLPKNRDALLLAKSAGVVLELAVDAIGYSGGVISDARLSAALSDGAIIITRASALLPGGSDLAIAGTIEAENGQPRFAGAVEASSDNLRGLLDWLKAPMPAGVESDRLRKLSMTTRVTATPASVQVADIDLRIDSSRVTGGIAIGYNISNATTIVPSIRYAFRAPTDPLGTLGNETNALTGSGIQTPNLSRWGDYSTISVDPVDGCQMVFTTQFQPANGNFNWSTFIHSFKLSTCN